MWFSNAAQYPGHLKTFCGSSIPHNRVPFLDAGGGDTSGYTRRQSFYMNPRCDRCKKKNVRVSWKEINNAKSKLLLQKRGGRKKKKKKKSRLLEASASKWKSNAPQNGQGEKCAECPCVVQRVIALGRSFKVSKHDFQCDPY